jgi:hypothetical protein
MNKVIAITKFNDGIAFVFDEMPPMTYTKYGNKLIIGTNGIKYVVYTYDLPSPGFYAFEGRKFDIELTDGTIEHCYGQWWDGGYREAEKIIGERLVSLTSSTVQELKKCYVFFGGCISAQKYNELIESYNGRLYGYREYETTITDNIYRIKAYKKSGAVKPDGRVIKNWKRFNRRVLLGENPILKYKASL